MLTEIRGGFISLYVGNKEDCPGHCTIIQKEMMMTKQKNRLVVGIGSALVDLLVNESDEFIKKTGAAKGGMTLVDNEFIDNILSMASEEASIVPGGSACNTMVGIGKLGGSARFIGKSGKGKMGKFFADSLEKNNVEHRLFASSSPTGRVLSIITPDTQRSMFTFLGAASEITSEEIMDGFLTNVRIVHIEGYLVYNKELLLTVLNAAKDSGAFVCLDLASFTIVNEEKKFLYQIIEEFVDILLANEDEAAAFTGCEDELDTVKILGEKAEIGILKVGERGSYIAANDNIIKVDPHGSSGVVDTTGAGDLWASGFLFGLAEGYSLEECGKIGSACGYEVCRVIGASIPDEGWNRIHNIIKQCEKRTEK